MRHVLIFTTYPHEDSSVLTGERWPDGKLPTTPLTRVELLPFGPQNWELRIDAIRIGTLVGIFRDRLDEQPPAP